MRRLPRDELAEGTRRAAPRLDGGTVGNCCRGGRDHISSPGYGAFMRPPQRGDCHVRTLDREAPSCVAAGF